MSTAEVNATVITQRFEELREGKREYKVLSKVLQTAVKRAEFAYKTVFARLVTQLKNRK